MSLQVPDHLREMWGEPRPHEVRYWKVNPNEIRGRVIRCRGYNANELSLYGWCWAPALSKARKPMFMEALRGSIREQGIRNPVVAYSIDGDLYLSFGGSRALAAQELDLQSIPCIINDYDGRYGDALPVGPDNVQHFYTDAPTNYVFGDYGFEQHYGLEKNRRAEYDPAGIAWVSDIDNDEFLKREFAWLDDYTPTTGD